MAAVPLPLAIVAIAAGVLALGMAAVVARAAPSAATNRLLSAILVLEGAFQATLFLPPRREGILAVLEGLWVVPVMLLPWLYLLFLAGLETRLARPLRRARTAAKAILVVFAAAATLGLAQSALGSEPVWLFPLLPISLMALAGTSLLGLVVAWSAWRGAPARSLARERAASYALAFGIRDSLLVLAVVAFFVEEAIAPKEGIHLPAVLLLAFATLLFVPLLAYGALRVRLFGVEAKIRWTISRGAIGTAFLVAYIVGSQAAGLIIAPRFGPAAGIVAAALLILALVPLQRGAERLAAAAVPQPSPGSLEDRRLEAYRLAVEEHVRSGDREPGPFVEALRARFGITAREHAIVMHFVHAGPPADPPGFEPGSLVLDRFRVLRPLGEGGYAQALLARDEDLGREIVVKVYHPDREPTAVLREARAIAAVRHPAVVTVHDVAVARRQAILIMEHVSGGSLRECLAHGPLDQVAFARVARDLGAALVAVHEVGIVHGDIKPANVLLTGDGHAKLADFGVAGLVALDVTQQDGPGDLAAAGTIPYMSPEQAKGVPATAASDQYALALTLFEAFTGAQVFTPREGETTVELRRRVARGTQPSLPSGLGPELRAWFRRTLAPAPRERFPDAATTNAALLDALTRHES